MTDIPVGTRVRVTRSPMSYDLGETGVVVEDDREPSNYIFPVRVRLDRGDEITRRYGIASTHSYCRPEDLEILPGMAPIGDEVKEGDVEP